jgi:hypothetical protein
MRSVLWCAVLVLAPKTIGSAFRYGAGYKDLEIDSARLLSRRTVVAAVNANIPTEMTIKLHEPWNTRGYGGEYEDVDHLFAMYLLYNLGKYGVRVDERTKLLGIDESKEPMAYPEAARPAFESARSDSAKYAQRTAFRPEGTRIGEAAN